MPIAASHGTYPSSSSQSTSFPTELHRACASQSCTISQLRAHLLARPSASSVRDKQGRLPLHLLSNRLLEMSLFTDNAQIVLNKEMEAFIMDLFLANPQGIITFENGDGAHSSANIGKIPFSDVILQWIESCHTQDTFFTAGDTDYTEALASEDADLLDDDATRASVLTMPTIFRNEPLSHNLYAQRVLETNDDRDDNASLVGTVRGRRGQNSDEASRSTNNRKISAVGTHASTSHFESISIYEDLFPTKNMLFVPPIVEFSFRVLSNILDYIDGQYNKLRFGKLSGDSTEEDCLQQVAFMLVEHYSSVPSFTKLLLLIDDYDPMKERIFGMTLIQRVIHSPSTIGDWLVYMLECVDATVARKAVDYFEIMSRGSIGGTYLEIQKGKEKEQLYLKVSQLDYIVHALLALEDEQEVDRAASTEVVQNIVDREMDKAWPLSLALVDGLCLFLFILTFQSGTNMFLNLENSSGELQTGNYFALFFLALLMEIYFVIRKLCQWRAMYKISPGCFWSNSFSLWDMFDFTAVLMALGCTLAMDISIHDGVVTGEISNAFRSTLAATSGFLWLKLLFFLKRANSHITAAVFLVAQIAQDLRWILLLLAMAVMAFAQMFFVTISQQNGCEDGTSQCDFAKDYFFRTYAMVFGSFDPEDFSGGFSAFLFVIFSALIMLVIFNALIAITIDSYERWTVQSKLYIGRARLAYLAELNAIQNLLSGKWSLMQYCAVVLFISSVSVIFLMSIDSIRSAMGVYYGSDTLIIGVIVLLVFLFISVMAFLSHMNYYESIEGKEKRTGILGKFAGSRVVKYLAFPIKICTRWILGLNADSRSRNTKLRRAWPGKVSYLNEEMVQMTNAAEIRTKLAVNADLKSMESRVKKSEDRSRADILTEMRAAEARMQKMMSDLKNLMMDEKSSASVDSRPASTVVSTSSSSRVSVGANSRNVASVTSSRTGSNEF